MQDGLADAVDDGVGIAAGGVVRLGAGIGAEDRTDACGGVGVIGPDDAEHAVKASPARAVVASSLRIGYLLLRRAYAIERPYAFG